MNPDDEKDQKPTDNPGDAPANEAPQSELPADALSMTPDELEQEQAASAAETPATSDQPEEKQPSGLRKLLRKANVYFLLFLLVVAIGIIITVVNYLNSQKEAPQPTIASQELTEEALRQLANTDSSVGDTNQTLTIKGNAVIEGQTLMRGNLNLAGNFQSGGSIQGPELTISGTSNLGTAQINSLQVASDTAVQGTTTMRDLNVSGVTSFSGPVTASQITVTRLIMSGNASLEVPNHIGFTGSTPGRTINQAQLGSGGSASVSGSDTAGTININTGNSPAAGCMMRVVFVQQFSKQPYVQVSPIGAAAGRTQYYVERDQSGFSICAASPAPANQSFAFDYFVSF